MSQGVWYALAGVPSSHRATLLACETRYRQRSERSYPHSRSSSPGPGFVAKTLCGVYGPGTIQPLLERRRDRRCATSLLLPQILALPSQGLSYPKIAQRLGLTTRQVEHVMVRHRERHLNER